MQKNKTKSLMFTGFGVMSLILIIIVGFWIQSVSLSEKRLADIINEQHKLRVIEKMKDITYQRAVSILRMSAMNDVIDRNDEFNYFTNLASVFIESRDDLLKNYFTQTDYNEWLEVVPYVNSGSDVQTRVAVMLLEKNDDQARQVILNEVVPRQDELKHALNVFTDKVKARISEVSNNAVTYSTRIYVVILILVLSALFIGFTVARFVVENAMHSERIIMNTRDKIRRLYKVSSETGISDEKKIEKMLSIGCDMLGMDCGIISQVDKFSQIIKTIYTSSNDRMEIGMSIPIRESLSEFVLSTSETFIINDISKSEFTEFYEPKMKNIQSCIARSLIIKGKKFGALSFTSESKRDKGFSSEDIDLVNLMASWVVFSIERDMDHAELTSIKDAAEKANKAKSEFLGNMSHELRTPMHAILSYAGFGVRKFDTSSDVKKKSYFEKIHKSAEGLLYLLNNILDLAKLESGKMQFEFMERDIDEITREIIDELNGLCAEKNIKIEVSKAENIKNVEVDVDKIRQVLRNIISNSIKYSPHDSRVKIRIDELNDAISYSISDEGPGIPETEIKSIFNKFIQSSTTNNGAGGTGLGLSICKEIVTAHGGKIWAENNKKCGSVFIFTLPVQNKQSGLTEIQKFA